MNQRIRELAEQCFSIRYDHDSKMEEFGNDSIQIISEFTNLIVQECIKELETTQVCDSYTGKMIDCEYNDALADGIANIKENFGVEE